MTNTDKPRRAKLWREGMRLFRRNLHAWFGWSVWFFIAFAISQALFMVHMSAPEFTAIADQANKMNGVKPELTHDQIMGLANLFAQAALALAPLMIGLVLQSFAYQVFFMKQQPGIGSPKLGVGRFFYMVWIYIVLFFIKGVIALVLIEAPWIAGFMLGKTTPFAIPAAAIVSIIGVGILLFISFRLALAPTLAICASKPVLKNSWKLMKKNCWRLFWNGLVLVFVLIFLAIAVVIAELGISMALAMGAHAVFAHIAPDPNAASRSFMARFFAPAAGSIDEQIVTYVRIMFGSVNMCLGSGIMAAFYCAVVRVLYEEKQADDPAFKLVA